MNKLKTILPIWVEWFNVICAIYLVSTLLFPFDYQRPALYLYSISLLTDLLINHRYKKVKWCKARWVFLIMILFYLCIWIWHIFEETNLPYFQVTAEKRIGLLIAGILGLFTNINPKLKPQYLAIPIMIVGISIIIYILFKINFINATYESFTAYQKAIASYRGGIMKISHMNFNLYLNYGVMLGFWGIVESNKLRTKIIYSISIVVTTFIVITGEGRIGFVTILILLGILCFYIVRKRHKKLLIPTSLALIITISILFNNHYKMKEYSLQDNPRFLIWKESITMIQERPLTGYGISDGRNEFVTRLFQNKEIKTQFIDPWFIEFPHYNKYSLHSHNIFLESMIEFGIMGLFLICLILFLPIISTKGKKQKLLTIFILIFTIQGLTESPGNHLSIFLLSWFLYIIMLYQIEDPKEKALEN